MLNVILAVLFLMHFGTPPVQNTWAEMQTFIPDGMPIKLEFCLDKSESSITKYTIKRIISTKDGNAKGAMFLVVMLGEDGKVCPEEGSVLSFPSYQLSDPMTLATGDPCVKKILVMVEWLETKSGKWVVDNSDRRIPLEAVVERGASALPKSKFVPRSQP